MVARTATSRLAALALLLSVSVAVRAANDTELPLKELSAQVDQRLRDGQYQVAARLAEELVARAEKSSSLDPAVTAMCREKLAHCYGELGRLAEAEGALLQARAFWEKAGPDESFSLAENLSRLGTLYGLLGNLAEAETCHRRALELRRQLKASPANQEMVQMRIGDSLHCLGELYRRQSRYAKAEPLLTEALRLRRQYLPDDPLTSASLLALGELYRAQGRLDDARQQFAAALATGKSSQGDAKRLALHRAGCLASLALLHYDEWDQTGRDADAQRAEQYYHQALEAFAKGGFASHVNRAECLNNLGRLYHEQAYRAAATRRWDDAQRNYQEALAIFSQDPKRCRARIVDTLNNLALLEHDRGKLPRAEEYLQQATRQIGDGSFVPLEFRYNTHYVRAKVAWAAGRRLEALDELRHAMDLAAHQRILASGTAHERAQYFTQLTDAFERMVQWQASPEQREDPQRFEQAYQAIERSRAMSLLDQMRLEKVDLWEGMEGNRRSELQQMWRDCRAKMAQCEHVIGVRGKQLTDSEFDDLVQQRAEARQQYQELQRELWNSSPAYRRAVGDLRQGVPWAKLRAWATRRKALLLEYLIGVEGSYVLVVPAHDGPPSLETLLVGEKEAKVFGIRPGPLTAQRLQHLLQDRGAGVLPQLRRSEDPARLVRALHALWNVLVPPGAQKELFQKSCHHAVVVPDGILNRLPFEVLVTLPSDPPSHLLESGPPLAYAPSATILMSLVESESPHVGTPSLLTLGGCDYGRSVVSPQAGQSQRAVWQSSELPNSAAESDSVAAAFRGVGWKTVQYKGAQATEMAFRTSLPGQRLVHLACHGLADQSYGNLFGMLLFTPSRTPAGPDDDGTLWLDDVYQLPLRDCELVLLSACDTNLGPTQRGEGVWALSRGFLVAGARRVVASNWLLDDEAAATLVSHLCSILAAAEKAGQKPDYAQALQQAKRRVHQQEKWRSPLYWGAVVLVGPN